ncbi:Uncharacterised protein [Bordetella pertussis]|nr:Uncharacterised protein [Bordetella pertussis]
MRERNARALSSVAGSISRQRSQVSCTMSSASDQEPSIRYASPYRWRPVRLEIVRARRIDRNGGGFTH